ncbi:MAG: AAA family ATPase, partial [Bacteroidales bacterium]
MKDNESCQILAARQENPFFNRSAVHNPALFIGREELIRKIFSRIISAKPQSISLFGERRIGKSSILSQINSPLIQGKYISNPEKYIFAYIDFQQFVQANPINFFKTLLKLLSLDPKSPEIRKTESNGYNEFSEFLNSCKTGEIKLVLLFDEFEKITKNPSFNVEFYAFLRSVANNFDVAFITSSFAVLQDLCHSNQIADSPFFNIFSSFRIRPFTQAECETL